MIEIKGSNFKQMVTLVVKARKESVKAVKQLSEALESLDPVTKQCKEAGLNEEETKLVRALYTVQNGISIDALIKYVDRYVSAMQNPIFSAGINGKEAGERLNTVMTKLIKAQYYTKDYTKDYTIAPVDQIGYEVEQYFGKLEQQKTKRIMHKNIPRPIRRHNHRGR